MVQLVLLLLGAQAVQRHWLRLAFIGLVWTALGLVVIADPLDDVQDIAMEMLGALLVVEGAIRLLVALLSEGERRLRAAKAAALVVLGLLTIKVPWETPWPDFIFISLLFGLVLAVDGAVRVAGTLLVRFPGWRVALAAGGIELTLALLAFSPWPVPYRATVPFCVGMALVLSGWAVLRSALLLRRLPPDAPITSLPIFEGRRGWCAPVLPGVGMEGGGVAEAGGSDRREMIVHVWTALDSAADPVRRPLLDRYVAATDRRGAVSTGHASLGMAPDLYISHYSLEDPDRGSLEFRRALHAGVENDVPGRFLPSYEEEVASWCEASAHVVFRHFDAERLWAFWAAYRQDATYNLTNRNCSVAVALALDAALEGALGRARASLPRLFVHPDLYLATLLRKHAQTMTWTPGLVLDYARQLQHVVEPRPSVSWVAALGRAATGHRQVRHARRAHAAARKGARHAGRRDDRGGDRTVATDAEPAGRVTSPGGVRPPAG